MSYAFIERTCTLCDGEGCEHCCGTGVIGSYEEVPSITLPETANTAFGKELRKWRESNRIGMREAAQAFGLSVSELSALERGQRDPTPEEERKFSCLSGVSSAMNESCYRDRVGTGEALAGVEGNGEKSNLL